MEDTTFTSWELDPLGHWQKAGYQPIDVINACGVLLQWLHPQDPDLPLRQYEKRYPFCGGKLDPLPGGRIDDLGRWLFPGDPPFYPYATTIVRGHRVYIYPSAFVGIVDTEGRSKVVRMD